MPKPKQEDYTIEEVERRRQEEEEQYRLHQQQLEQQAKQLEVVGFEEEEEEIDMANNLRWSVQNVAKFYGEPGQSATQHLYEFDDFLRAARIVIPDDAEVPENDRDASHIINDFVITLKGKARVWFNMKIPEGRRTTKAHWDNIRAAFKENFHPSGSTKEQRINFGRTWFGIQLWKQLMTLLLNTKN